MASFLFNHNWKRFACYVNEEIVWHTQSSQYHGHFPEYLKIHGELLEFMGEIYGDEYQNLLCNDSEILRHFYISNYKTFLSDHCIFYSKEEDFYAAFSNKDYNIISPDFLLNNLQETQKGYIFTQAESYTQESQNRISTVKDIFAEIYEKNHVIVSKFINYES